MKPPRPRLTADPAAVRRVYDRQRELRYESIDVMVSTDRRITYVSEQALQQLKAACPPTPHGEAVGGLPPLGGMPIQVVGWLPHFRKKHRPSVERRLKRLAEQAEARRRAERDAAVERGLSDIARFLSPPAYFFKPGPHRTRDSLQSIYASISV